MIKSKLKKSWRRLDNTAKIFSLDDKNNTNTFRYSVILKQKIDRIILKKALKKSLDYFTVFKVKIGAGLFWNYFEYNSKPPIISKEKDIPCQHINFKKNNDYLFKITYYKNKINLDIFHALTDGTGAIEFLKSIIYNYLDLKNSTSTTRSNRKNNIDIQDLYLKKYDKNIKENIKFKSAYLLPQKTNRYTNNTYHYIIDLKEIKNICKNYNVTITQYLTALYIYALYLSLYNKSSKKEIIITVPIDLRKYYRVDTLANFFVCMNINPKILEKKLNNFDDILMQVHTEFKHKLNKSHIEKYLARDVKLGMNITIRLIPLFIKKLFIKYIGTLVSRTSTSTLSNVGIIDIDDKYKKYIDNIMVLVMPGRVQKVKCTICSFNNNLNVTMNSNIDDIEFEYVFYNLLKEKINNLKLESNTTIDIIHKKKGTAYVSQSRN